jgi:hypothetical protein
MANSAACPRPLASVHGIHHRLTESVGLTVVGSGRRGRRWRLREGRRDTCHPSHGPECGGGGGEHDGPEGESLVQPAQASRPVRVGCVFRSHHLPARAADRAPMSAAHAHVRPAGTSLRSTAGVRIFRCLQCRRMPPREPTGITSAPRGATMTMNLLIKKLSILAIERQDPLS